MLSTSVGKAGKISLLTASEGGEIEGTVAAKVTNSSSVDSDMRAESLASITSTVFKSRFEVELDWGCKDTGSDTEFFILELSEKKDAN